ncbi:MAG TPA: hypothetical protein PJ997_01575 [Candidatus Paceibacterota bacterium]|nr:hypothetical protein [Candidatus Paceibacterota bacterium]HMP19009.1 hypothetical protein [Candidatus Paceibacterota bacterium]HMP85376.1 hypothetical protein [Candidatus Paceibacterota bacterium]
MEDKNLEKEIEQQNEKELNIRPLRTYEQDVANFVKKGQISTAKIVMAEQKRKERQEKIEKVEKVEKLTSNSLRVSIFLVFTGIAIVLGIFYYTQYSAKKTEEISGTEFRDILMNKKVKREIIVNDKLNSDIKREFISQIQNPPQLNFSEIAEIQLIRKNIIRQQDGKQTEQKEKVSIGDLFTFLDFKPENLLIRSLEENYLSGIIGTNSGTFPFILIKTKEYQNVFSGMLDWEKNMFREVNDIFFQTLPTDDFIVNPPSFVDIIISNRDARAILGENGEIQFYYSFINNNHLLLASKTEVISEMQKKLNLQNIVR